MDAVVLLYAQRVPSKSAQFWCLIGTSALLALLAIVFLDRELAVHCKSWSESMPREIHSLVECITEAGDSMWWLTGSVLAFTVFALRKQHNLARWAFALFAAVGLSGLAVIAMKPIIGRYRPKLLHEADEYGFEFLRFSVGYDSNSFPSGHATTISAAAVILWSMFPKWRVPIVLLWLSTCASRLMLGAHFLGDVIAGCALGASVGALVLTTWRRQFAASVPTPLHETS